MERKYTTTYYHYDGIGAVTGLTDVNAKLLQSYSYDAFGNALMVQGQGKGAKNIVNPYGFSTKEYNPKSGLSYFGARYYDPVVGRFVTKDLWPGTIEDPSTLNKYAYCNNNPVNLIDLYGLCPETGITVPVVLLTAETATLATPILGDEIIVGGVIIGYLVVEGISDYIIYAQNKKQAKKVIEGQERTIKEHEEKLKKDPDSINASHWGKEIKAAQDKINRLKKRWGIK